MLNNPRGRLEASLTHLARDTWDRLRDIKAFSRRPEPFRSVRFGETTITDLAMMYLCRNQVSESLFLQTPPDQERIQGTDFEWWIGTKGIGWFRLAVQAKKLDVKSDRYRELGYKPKNGQRQIDLLTDYASRNHATPLYCLYNYSDYVDGSAHWHCCQRNFTPRELGCSLTLASHIQQAIRAPRGNNFDFVHQFLGTLPWQCMASCPRAMQALNEGKSPSSPTPFALFDPESFYDDLPPFRPTGGGLLVPDPQDTTVDASAVSYKLSVVELDTLDAHYSPIAGYPRSILVTDLETDQASG